MSFTIVLLLMVLPVLAICVLAVYLGMSGIEDEKKARTKNRKSLENELIQNNLWKLVGADASTLDKVIRFLLENEWLRTRMSDEERMKKIALLREYKDAVRGSKKETKKVIWNYNPWSYKNCWETDFGKKDLWNDPLPFSELEAWMSNSPVGFAEPFKD